MTLKILLYSFSQNYYKKDLSSESVVIVSKMYNVIFFVRCHTNYDINSRSIYFHAAAIFCAGRDGLSNIELPITVGERYVGMKFSWS